MTINKQKVFLLMLCVVLTTLGKQACYANNNNKNTDTETSPLAIYETKRTPIDSKGVSIVGYVPLYQEGIIVSMNTAQDSLAPDAWQTVKLKIENRSPTLFKLINMFPEKLFVDNRYRAHDNNCGELKPQEICIFTVEGKTLPLDNLGSSSRISVIYMDSTGKKDKRYVRPWPPIYLSSASLDFSQEQDLTIRNIYPDDLNMLEVKETYLVGDGSSLLDFSECKIISSDGLCKIKLPRYPDTKGKVPSSRYLTIKYQVEMNAVREDIFGIGNVLANPSEALKEEGKETGDTFENDGNKKIPSNLHTSVPAQPSDSQVKTDDEYDNMPGNNDNKIISPSSYRDDNIQGSSYSFNWIMPILGTVAAGGVATVYYYTKHRVGVNPLQEGRANDQPGNIVPMAAMVAAVADTLLPPNPVEDFQPKDLTREPPHGTPPAVLPPAVQENPRAEALIIPGRRPTMLMTTADAAIIKAREEARAEEALAVAKREREAAYARLEEANRAAEARRKEAEVKKKLDIEAEQRKRMEAEVRRRPPTETPGSTLLSSAPGEKRYPSRSTTRVKKPGDYFN